MKITGAHGTDAPLAPAGEPSRESVPVDGSAPARSDEVALIELKNQLALDGERESLQSNISAGYHRMAMAVISNLKC